MPTAYTSKLMQDGQTFRDFLLTCARAFIIHQRDEPLSEPPKKQEPADYYANRLKEAHADLAKLAAMTPEEQCSYGATIKTESIGRYLEALNKERAENERLEDMRLRVLKWTPPTPEHEGIKAFMLRQIGVCKHDLTWLEQKLRDCQYKAPELFFAEALATAEREITYYAEEDRKERKRIATHNEWVDALYTCLDQLERTTQ